VVLATGVTPLDTIYHALQGRVPGLHLIGEAREPRKALDAIHEGFETGMVI